jgi:hypothetical protein
MIIGEKMVYKESANDKGRRQEYEALQLARRVAGPVLVRDRHIVNVIDNLRVPADGTVTLAGDTVIMRLGPPRGRNRNGELIVEGGNLYVQNADAFPLDVRVTDGCLYAEGELALHDITAKGVSSLTGSIGGRHIRVENDVIAAGSVNTYDDMTIGGRLESASWVNLHGHGHCEIGILKAPRIYIGKHSDENSHSMRSIEAGLLQLSKSIVAFSVTAKDIIVDSKNVYIGAHLVTTQEKYFPLLRRVQGGGRMCLRKLAKGYELRDAEAEIRKKYPVGR